MRVRFDSRPLVLRRAYTATMRATTVLEWRDQVNHGLHLFFIIAAAVIARNVAIQQVLDAPPPAGPEGLGQLYMIVALIAGLAVAAVGWIGRNYDARAVASVVHLGAAAAMGVAYVLPSTDPYYAIGKYVVMEISAASLLLVFGIMLGARLGPREARRVAARVGAGGIIGGLVGGAALTIGATFLGSRELFLVAAAMAVVPVFWLPSTHQVPMSSLVTEAHRDRPDVPELSSYGRWVALTTLIMVATTTLVDYEFRVAARTWFRDDDLTAFFGFVVILAGITTIFFQLTALDRLLDKVGLFATATVMPGALIICSAAFGVLPTLTTLVVLKLVDSGANMSVQQATGGLLLAPLGMRARAIWQGRIDGIAKRSGQLISGMFLAVFPWSPTRVLPISMVLCALWVTAILLTRHRYINLLTAMLGKPSAQDPEVRAYDGSTIHLLEKELEVAAPARAAVILDLLEQAEHPAPRRILEKIAGSDPDGQGALVVIDHLTVFKDTKALTQFANGGNSSIAGAALLALDDVDPAAADRAAMEILVTDDKPDELRALAAGLLAGHNPDARVLARELAQSDQSPVRLAVAQALGRMHPGASQEIGQALCALARDEEPEVARAALNAVGNHLSPEACEVALRALQHRHLRGAGMRALASLGPPVVPPIAAELQTRRDDPSVASALTWALGHIGVAASVPPLVEALGASHTSVRLSAAVALNNLVRRRPELDLPVQEIEACYLPEIRYCGLLRDGSLCGLPNTPAGIVLRHSLKQRAQASLETLFRLFSLRYPEDSIGGAFLAINSRDRSQRQLALELLDTLLESAVRRALSEAIGEGTGRRKSRDRVATLKSLAEAPDRFIAELASIVLADLDGESPRAASSLSAEDKMRRSLVDQILELQSVALFAQASAEDLGEVAALVTERQVPVDTIVYNEGDSGDAMYLIRSGGVLLTRKGITVERLAAGDALGIVSVLDRLPRELTATTSTRSTLLVIKASDLHQLLADRPLLMHSIFRALTSSIRTQLDRVSLGKRTSD